MISIVKSRLACAAIVAYLCLTAATARAVVVWDESVSGDLSNDRLNPTALTLVLGSNTLLATSGGAGPDREYVSFSMPAGSALSAIVLQAYSGLDGTAFIGVQSGATFTEPATGTNVANLLGWAHFGTGTSETVGVDVLPKIGTGPGAIGFTPPLPGGNYTFWIQQTNTAAPSTYTFDFVATPEPAALALCGAAGFVLPLMRRRRAGRLRV